MADVDSLISDSTEATGDTLESSSRGSTASAGSGSSRGSTARSSESQSSEDLIENKYLESIKQNLKQLNFIKEDNDITDDTKNKIFGIETFIKSYDSKGETDKVKYAKVTYITVLKNAIGVYINYIEYFMLNKNKKENVQKALKNVKILISELENDPNISIAKNKLNEVELKFLEYPRNRYLDIDEFEDEYLSIRREASIEASGGYGNVYMTQDYIVKTQTSFTNFIRELNVCCSYDCIYVINIEHWSYYQETDGTYVYCFAQPRGLPVRNAIKEGKITVSQVAIDVYKGMKFLHDDGLIHLDIKPDNIVCFPKIDGSGWYATIIDFGLGMYGYEYKNGLFSYQNLGYTVNYRDPEYNIDTFNSSDSDYYAYGITIARLWAEKYLPSLKLPLFFFDVSFITDSDLRDICESCIKSKDKRDPKLSEHIKNKPFFRGQKFDTLGIKLLSYPLELSQNCDELYIDLSQKLQTLLTAPVFQTRARTGFLAHHLVHMVMPYIFERDFEIELENYIICCFFLSQVIYSETDIQIESIVDLITTDEINYKNNLIETTLEILQNLNGVVRYLTFWDYSPSVKDIGPNLRGTISCKYPEVYRNEKIYSSQSKVSDPDNKNILFSEALERMPETLINSLSDRSVTPFPSNCNIIVEIKPTEGARRLREAIDQFNEQFGNQIGDINFWGMEILFKAIIYRHSIDLLPASYRSYINRVLYLNPYGSEILREKYFSNIKIM